MLQRAIVIRTATKTEARLGCFLDLLGIEWEALNAAELVDRYQSEILAGSEIPAGLIICGEGLRELESELDKSQIPPAMISGSFKGSLFHSFGQSPASLRSLERFFNGTKFAAPPLSFEQPQYHISDKHPEMCGALSGLRFRSLENALNRGIQLELRAGVADSIISVGEASLLTYLRQRSRELFIIAAGEIQNLKEPISANVDFRSCFSGLIPILIALRHLFRGSCWVPEAHYANIIIDDPPLWPRYGYLDLRELAAFVDQTGCACTIAMIPWNYRRSDRRIVRLISSRQLRLGICVHGCNHTSAEFGCQDREGLAGMLATARHRMGEHQQQTGLPYQQIMVFPQGIFSVEAMSCLSTQGYLAAVNTELIDCWHKTRVTLQDYLGPAILCYDTPLFTRRKPEDGIVNFAVDSFLGKPCLVVLHHDFFKMGMRNLEELVGIFTNFRPKLLWDTLENIVKTCALSKRDAETGKTVRTFVNRTVRAERLAVQARNESVRETASVALRRYLCEFRDNYLIKSETLVKCAGRIARSWRRY